MAQLDEQSVMDTEESQAETTARTSMRSDKAQWFTIGAKIGYNVSPTHDKIKDLYSLHTGLRQGGSMGLYMRLGTNFFCQPELLYSFSIYESKRIICGDTLSRKLQSHTIDLPVLFGYSPICSETFKLRVLIGPRFSFNVNKNKKYDAVPVPTADESIIKASMSKTRLGLDCGIGFDFWRITLDLRYVLIQDVHRYQYNTESDGWKKVTFPVSTFHIALGYNLWGNNMPSSKKQKYDPDAYDFFNKKN